MGLKNYLDAETSFKKAIDLTSQAANTITQASNPDPQATSIDPQLVAAADAGLGEVYARTRMVDEANASVAAAVKADPAHAAMYLRNLALIYFQEKNISAQIDAADEAIKANPKDAFLYFVKAQGLAVNAPIDPATNKIKLSAECLVAFREYWAWLPPASTPRKSPPSSRTRTPRTQTIQAGAASPPAQK